jgi:hypothetical protein
MRQVPIAARMTLICVVEADGALVWEEARLVERLAALDRSTSYLG